MPTGAFDKRLRTYNEVDKKRVEAAEQRASAAEQNIAVAEEQYQRPHESHESFVSECNTLVISHEQLSETHRRCVTEIDRLSGALTAAEEQLRACTEALEIHQSANQRLRDAWNQHHPSHEPIDDRHGPDYAYLFDILMQETDQTNRINSLLREDNESMQKTISECVEKEVEARMITAEARVTELEETLKEAHAREDLNFAKPNEEIEIANNERQTAEAALRGWLAAAKEPPPPTESRDTQTGSGTGDGEDDRAVGLLRVQVAELERRVRIVSEHGDQWVGVAEREVEWIRAELASAHEASRELEAKRRRTAEVTHVPLGRFLVSRPSVAFGSFH